MTPPKVLFLDHPEADFLSSLLYAGLVEELGAANVVDWPYKGSFHGETQVYPSLYTPGQTGLTAPYAWMPAIISHPWTTDEVFEHLDQFDLIVLASPRGVNSACLQQLIDVFGRDALPKLVLVDGEDYDSIRWDLVQAFAPSIYFKRELVEDAQLIYPAQHAACSTRSPATRIVPLSLASPIFAPLDPTPEKDIDILLLGGNNRPDRATIVEVMNAHFGSRFVSGRNFPYAAYREALARAKIAISVRGHGWDTLRFYEIPAHEGTLLVTDRSPRQSEFPFEADVHCGYFNTAEDLVTICNRYLNDEPARQRVAAAGNAWLNRHHTAHARARYLLDESFR